MTILTGSFPADVRQMDNIEAKVELCSMAAKLIHNGNVLSMDSSTTVQFMGDLLSRFSGLTVLTQGQKLIEKLQYAPLNVYCSGVCSPKRRFPTTERSPETFFRRSTPT